MFVLQVTNGQVYRVPVAEGIRQDSLQEVFGAIAPGDLVVSKGTEELEENTPVKVTAAKKQKQKISLAD